MNATAAAKPARVAAERAVRTTSIDIFRGLTILVMVFVNSVAGVRGLPWWTYHMPGDANGMTYVDMVFPTFLFIVGLSIPLAVKRRIERGGTALELWQHLVVRSVGLMVMGAILANHSQVDAGATSLSRTTWTLLAYAGILLVWIVYPRNENRKWLFRVMRGAGLVLLAYVLATFRRRLADGQVAWLDFSYLEILGLIGEAYLCAGALYLLSKSRPLLVASLFVALSLLNIFCTAGWVRWNIWPLGSGASASIVLAGVVVSMLVIGSRPWKNAALLTTGFAAALAVAGWALMPLGISKNRATPTWCLYSAAAAAVLFVALYWLADRQHMTRWAAFVKPAGANTLLTYLLPWIWSAVPGIRNLGHQWNAGAPGALKAAAFTGVILAIAAVLTKLKLRMQL